MLVLVLVLVLVSAPGWCSVLELVSSGSALASEVALGWSDRIGRSRVGVGPFRTYSVIAVGLKLRPSWTRRSHRRCSDAKAQLLICPMTFSGRGCDRLVTECRDPLTAGTGGPTKPARRVPTRGSPPRSKNAATDRVHRVRHWRVDLHRLLTELPPTAGSRMVAVRKRRH